jgi:hypothetical protein
MYSGNFYYAILCICSVTSSAFSSAVTNNKEINIYDTITENEITTTTTVIYNQIIGTITTLLVLYILLTLNVVVNIINVFKGPLQHAR